MDFSKYLSSGAKSFKFANVGDSITGVIEDVEEHQAREYMLDGSVGELQFWNDGTPKMQIKIIVQTDLRDDDNPDDDGRRTVWVRLWGTQRRALLSAMREQGLTDLPAGTKFYMVYTGNGETPAGYRGFPPKIYEIKVKAGEKKPGTANWDNMAQPSPQGHPAGGAAKGAPSPVDPWATPEPPF